MKHNLATCLILVAACLPVQSHAQTVIGGQTPDSSAILDVQSTNRGMLLPRMTTEQRSAIQGPQTGLLIFNTTLNCVELNLGTPAAPAWQCLAKRGSVASLACGTATLSGTLRAGQAASGASASVPYTGGNGGTFNSQTLASTGVTGLTATLSAGNFATGTGTLGYTISGTPSASGTAYFALNAGGQACTLEVEVAAACGAYVAPGVWKGFMCHNLAAANTAAEPLMPGWELIGGYWQWGRKGQVSPQWLNNNTLNFAHGPTGPDLGAANEDAVGGWDQTTASNEAWSDAAKPDDDPCPAGYRVPTKAQWEGVLANNAKSNVGGSSWTNSATSYSSGVKFGDELFLPAAGFRNATGGELSNRGALGFYWSSTRLGEGNAHLLYFDSSVANIADYLRGNGFSVRCIAQ